MKTYSSLLLIVVCFLSCQYSSSDSMTPKAKIDYDQASIDLMKDLAPQVVGTWTLRQVRVKYRNNDYYQSQIKITKDSTFQNLATLTIVPAAIPRTSPRDLRQGEYDGTIQYGGKTYPVQFNLLASSEWIVSKKGPQAFFLFDYRFPDGWRVTEPEEAFLKNIGLIGDNFSMETTTGQPTMIWRGLNRGVERIDLVKR